MKSATVVNIVNKLQSLGVEVWVDGGWCIDALLGSQTREHEDLDIAVHRKDNDKLRETLAEMGYSEEVSRSDSSEFMYVLKNSDNQEIDVHVFEYDEKGNNIYGVKYPFGSLTGTGKINNEDVKCIKAEWMFKFKTSYEPKSKDIQDVLALADKFNFQVPSNYLLADK